MTVPKITTSFNLTPVQAVEFFRTKGLSANFGWQDMLHEEHDINFTVAKMLDLDLLATVKDAVDQAIAEGKSFYWFQNELQPIMEKAGWWGKQDMKDPLTGEVREVQLGSARRLKIIYDTNMRTAYAAQHWEKIIRNAKKAPYLKYIAVDDDRTRPAHRAWSGLILRWDDPWWNTHYPPNGWNCRCSVMQLSDIDLKRMGREGADVAPPDDNRAWTNPRTGEIFQVPNGIDPGWGYHPGKDGLARISQALIDKVATAPADLGAAAFNSMEKQLVPELQKEFVAWVDTVSADMTPKGDRHVIGALNPKVVDYLTIVRNAAPESAAIAIDDSKLSHMLRDVKIASGKSIPLDYIKRLPELLANPVAILWDDDKKSLLYVFNASKDKNGRMGKIIVAVDYVRKTRQYDGTREMIIENRIISVGVVDVSNLRETHIKLIDGLL